MAIELTNNEKLEIVNQHLKSVDYSIYGLELDLLEAQAVGAEETQIASLNSRITSANNKRAALVEERDSLTTPTA